MEKREDFLMRFASVVRAKRDSMGWSRQDLSAASGIPIESIEEWEEMHSIPPLEGVRALADAFSCSMDELAGRIWSND